MRIKVLSERALCLIRIFLIVIFMVNCASESQTSGIENPELIDLLSAHGFSLCKPTDANSIGPVGLPNRKGLPIMVFNKIDDYGKSFIQVSLAKGEKVLVDHVSESDSSRAECKAISIKIKALMRGKKDRNGTGKNILGPTVSMLDHK